MTKIITAKNITSFKASEHFSELFKELLDGLNKYHMRDRHLKKNIYRNSARTLFQFEALVPLMNADEHRFHAFTKDEDEIREKYMTYLEDYKTSKKILDITYKMLESYPEHEFYYRVCPVSKEKFNVLTGNDILNNIKDFQVYTYGAESRSGTTGLFTILEDLCSRNDDIKISDNLHPLVVDRVKEEWNFSNDFVIDERIEDGTVLRLNIETGSVHVVYNPNNHINNVSVQNIKLYPNTKGLHYRIRGKKRVYLDLPDIEIK